MKYVIHDGITADPGSTLPNGLPETSTKDLLRNVLRSGITDTRDQLAFKLRRSRARSSTFMDKPLASCNDESLLLNELTEWIDEKRKHNPVVAVLAPWYEDATLERSEGYIRRIKEIDSSVLKDCSCIYLYECPYHRVNRPVVDRISENRLYIRYNSDFRAQRELADDIIMSCDCCYCHSVLRLIPAFHPEREDRWLHFADRKPESVILDIHGAVTEEAKTVGDLEILPWAEKAESILFENIRYAVSLTENMERYFSEKYGRRDIEYFRTPVMSQDIRNDDGCMIKDSFPEIVVYSGGCQKWQNIDMMIQAIKDNISEFRFCIFVSRPDVFINKWGNEPIPDNVTVKNGTPEEISEVYRKAVLGFILRDDTAVNRVACPTKLMEYIQFGIIPVIKSPNIGDFGELGLKALSVQNMTQAHDREKITGFVNINNGIVDELRAQNIRNMQALKNFINGR